MCCIILHPFSNVLLLPSFSTPYLCMCAFMSYGCLLLCVRMKIHAEQREREEKFFLPSSHENRRREGGGGRETVRGGQVGPVKDEGSRRDRKKSHHLYVASTIVLDRTLVSEEG